MNFQAKRIGFMYSRKRARFQLLNFFGPDKIFLSLGAKKTIVIYRVFAQYSLNKNYLRLT